MNVEMLAYVRIEGQVCMNILMCVVRMGVVVGNGVVVRILVRFRGLIRMCVKMPARLQIKRHIYMDVLMSAANIQMTVSMTNITMRRVGVRRIAVGVVVTGIRMAIIGMAIAVRALRVRGVRTE